MKDWLSYIKSYLDGDLWGFLALDWYHSQKNFNVPHLDPSHFIDRLLEELPTWDVDPVGFHKVLLCVSVQLMGNDFDEIIGKSVRFLAGLSEPISHDQLSAIYSHYSTYGERNLFIERLGNSGVPIQPAQPGAVHAPDGVTSIVSGENGRTNQDPILLFYSYSHEDKRMLKKLDDHLSLLKNQGYISEWYDRQILPGGEVDNEIDENLKKARMILLLVSRSFMASEYCTGVEMKFALQQHQLKRAIVIPVILRDCDWHKAPFSKLKALPTDGKPVAGGWKNQDQGFSDVAKGIRQTLESKPLILQK